MTYICYSHYYVHPSCIKFIRFVHRLADKFDAEVEYFDPGKKRIPKPRKPLPLRVWNKIYHNVRVWLRQRGVYRTGRDAGAAIQPAIRPMRLPARIMLYRSKFTPSRYAESITQRGPLGMRLNGQ